MAAIPTPASGTSGSTSARAPTGTSGSTGQRLPRPAFSGSWMNSGRRAFGRAVRPDRGCRAGAGRYSELLAINLLEEAAAAADGGDQRIAASPGTTGCATPASTSATIWRTAIFDIASVAHTFACRPASVAPVPPAAGSASSAGGRISASARPNCCSAPRVERSPPLGATSASKIKPFFPRLKNAPKPARANSGKGCE